MVDNVDVIRDAKPVPQAPVDPNVRLPDSAKRAIASAEAIHKQAYTPQPAEPEPAPAAAAAPPPPSEPTPPAAPPVAPEQIAPAAEPSVAREDFASNPDLQGKYDRMVASMNGRLKQKDDIIAGMNDQLNAMGSELSRVTDLLESRGTMPQPQVSALTDDDREFAGDKLLDVVRKVASEVVAPVVATQQNTLKSQARSAARAFYASLDQQMPEWRAINKDDKFKEWLRLPDVYSGRVRQSLLNDAVQSADALRALQFFKGFKSQTGDTPSPPLVPEPPQAPHRQAATTLEALAAPGRAKPAGGDTALAPAATEKPIYTRQNISDFYAHKRLFHQGKGAYVGRQAVMDQTEQDIIRAQGEGRVRG